MAGSPRYGQPTIIQTVGIKGRADTKPADSPDRPEPDTLGLLQSDAEKKFEQIDPRATAGRANSGTGTKHGGHSVGDGSSPSFAAQGASRSIKPAGDFAAVSASAPNPRVSTGSGGNPVRGKGKKTPPADEMVLTGALD